MVVLGSKALSAIKDKISKSIIFSMVVDSKYSAANVTGVSIDIPPKLKLSKLKEVLPQVNKIGIIYSNDFAPQYNDIVKVSKDLGLQVIGKEIPSAKEFASALGEIAGQIDCFLMVLDSKIYIPQVTQYLLMESMKRKIAVIGLSANYTKAGAILSIDCDYNDVGRQVGEIVQRIVSGEKIGDIPVQYPRKVKYSLNLVVAEQLRIKFSQSAINEAEKVFK